MKMTLRGRDIDYTVDAQGIFHAEYNGENYQHQTLAGLKDKITVCLKKKPIAIKILQIKTDSDRLDIRKGVLVGIHSGNRNLLIKWDGNRGVEQVRSWSGKILNPTVDLSVLKALYRAAGEAQKRFDDFIENNKFDTDEIPKD